MLRMFWKIERFDKDMKLIETKANVSRSLTWAFISMLYTRMCQTAPAHANIDVNSGSRNLSNSGSISDAFSLLQEDGYAYINSSASGGSFRGDQCGILIGDGATGVTYADYILAGKYGHGTDSSEFLYLGGCVLTPVVSAPYTYVDFERLFKNSSGGSNIVKELGFACMYDGNVYLVCRDILEAGDWTTVLNTEYLKVTYRMRTST